MDVEEEMKKFTQGFAYVTGKRSYSINWGWLATEAEEFDDLQETETDRASEFVRHLRMRYEDGEI